LPLSLYLTQYRINNNNNYIINNQQSYHFTVTSHNIFSHRSIFMYMISVTILNSYIRILSFSHNSKYQNCLFLTNLHFNHRILSFSNTIVQNLYLRFLSFFLTILNLYHTIVIFFLTICISHKSVFFTILYLFVSPSPFWFHSSVLVLLCVALCSSL